MTKLSAKLKSLVLALLIHERFRYHFCKWRFRLLKGKMRFLNAENTDIGSKTLQHNLDAFKHSAAFGMGGRMGLLLYPTKALFQHRPSAKVLIVGPRTEDDIFWARALGLRNTRGLDLFSYSRFIDIGDIHDTQYADESFDAILLGWMISYSSNPNLVIRECKRILAPGGILGIGIESNYEMKTQGKLPEGSPRVNTLNTSDDLIKVCKLNPVFVYDPELPSSYDCAVIVKKGQ